ERRPKLWNVKMTAAQGRRSIKGEARYAYAPGRSPAVFLLDRMGHWNGDRDCEPARLVAARMGESGERETPPRTEHRNPASGGPGRGFAKGHLLAGLSRDGGRT